MNKRNSFALIAIFVLVLAVSFALSACDFSQELTAFYDGEVFVGDQLDESKLTVVLIGGFGSHKLSRDSYTIGDFDSSAAGVKTVTVSYVSGDKTLSATFTVEVVAPVLTGIKAVYTGGDIHVGGEIDQTKVTVTATYSNGKSRTVSEWTMSELDASTPRNSCIVTVTFTDNGVTQTDTFEVNVVRTLTSIEAIYLGGEIFVGDSVDKSDVKVTAFFEDGTDVEVTDFELQPTTLSQTGETDVSVIYTFGGITKTTQITVTVVAPRLLSITAQYDGGAVLLGKQPSPDDLTVTANYSDGSSKPVDGFNVGSIDSTSTGSKVWNISYTEGDITVQTTVNVAVVKSFGPTEDKYDVNVIKDEALSIHFLMLGNKFTGDSVYVKAGDTDILIDAGSRYDSAATIEKYVKQYCTDGKLEYVVATHAHQDHIEGFVKNSSNGGGVLDRFEVDNIITYAGKNTTSKIAGYFTDKLNALKNQGVNVITAKDCVDNTNGGRKEYPLADGITMEILDQRYYHEKTSNENNYSVCLMIKQGDNNYLFTGDLEDNGEESLAALNDLPKVQLWKGGHHGSYTAGNEALLREIQPETVCICTCMGTTEYTQGQMTTSSFPALPFVERVARYTDRVYCTTDGTNFSKDSSSTCRPANGNIVFACTDEQITMYFSNNNLKLKETNWFKTTSWFQNSTKFPDNWRV